MKSFGVAYILEVNKVYKPTVIKIYFFIALTIRTQQHYQINGCKKVVFSNII